jgi:hypothetical protein
MGRFDLRKIRFGQSGNTIRSCVRGGPERTARPDRANLPGGIHRDGIGGAQGKPVGHHVVLMPQPCMTQPCAVEESVPADNDDWEADRGQHMRRRHNACLITKAMEAAETQQGKKIRPPAMYF